MTIATLVESTSAAANGVICWDGGAAIAEHSPPLMALTIKDTINQEQRVGTTRQQHLALTRAQNSLLINNRSQQCRFSVKFSKTKPPDESLHSKVMQRSMQEKQSNNQIRQSDLIITVQVYHIPRIAHLPRFALLIAV
jgi:hypothetical protein